MYINVFFHPSAFFSLLTAGLSSCSRHRGTQGGPPGPRTQVWSPAEVRATCSGGSKWHVCSGRHSEGVEPSKPMQTHVHSTLLACKKNAWRLMWYLESWMSSMTSDITNLVIRKFFPDTNMPEMWQFKLYSGVFNYMRPAFANELITNQSTTNPIASIISEIKFNLWIIDQPTTQPIYIFFARGTINMILPLRLLS